MLISDLYPSLFIPPPSLGSKYHAHEVVKLILSTGVSINTRDHAQRTALHIACLSHYLFQGHFRYLHVAEILLLNGIDYTLVDSTNRLAYECIDDEKCRNSFLHSAVYEKAQRARRRRAFLIVMNQKDFSLGLQRLGRTVLRSSTPPDPVVSSPTVGYMTSFSAGRKSGGSSPVCDGVSSGVDGMTSYVEQGVPPPPPQPHTPLNTDIPTFTNAHPYSDRYPYPHTNPGPVPNTITPPTSPILSNNHITTPSIILAPRPRTALEFPSLTSMFPTSNHSRTPSPTNNVLGINNEPKNKTSPLFHNSSPSSSSSPPPPPPPPPNNIPRSPSISREMYLPVFGRVRSMSLTTLFKKKSGMKNESNNNSPSPSNSPTAGANLNPTDSPIQITKITVKQSGPRHYPATYQVFSTPEMCAKICGFL